SVDIGLLKAVKKNKLMFIGVYSHYFSLRKAHPEFGRQEDGEW
ncbi:hypothetical protein EUBVEN_00001, partial [Eubacterium ventriosum ATCC 27560]